MIHRQKNSILNIEYYTDHSVEYSLYRLFKIYYRNSEFTVCGASKDKYTSKKTLPVAKKGITQACTCVAK